VNGGAAGDPEPALIEPGDVSTGDVMGAVEAMLFVADEPVTVTAMAAVLGVPEPQVAEAVARLAASLADAGRGIELRQVAGGWRLYTRPAHAEVVQRFLREGQQARLTQAALETLAVIAYRQPISRSRISAVRGVNVDGVIRTLLSRGLIEEAGTEDGTGATLYRTTRYFLEKLGINDLSELPPLADHLPEGTSIEALEEQLAGNE